MVSSNWKTSALLSILLIVIVWGSASAVTKLAVENMRPYLFAFLRNLTASLCLLFYYYALYRKNAVSEKKAPFSKLVWMGLTGITFFYLFFNIALYYTTAAAGALIQGFIPVAIILLSMIFLKEKLNRIQFVGVLLSVCGVLMISLVSTEQFARNYLLGNILMIFAVLSWGIYTVISKSVQQYDTVHLTTMSTCIGTILLLPAVLIESRGQNILPTIQLNEWLAILYLGILSSAVCYLLYNRVVKVLTGVQVGNFMNLDPVVGAIIAVLILKENLSWQQMAGAILILLGVKLTSSKSDPSH